MGRNMALALHVSEVARELQSSSKEFEDGRDGPTQANPCREESQRVPLTNIVYYFHQNKPLIDRLYFS